MSESPDNNQPQGATPSQPSPNSTPSPDNQSQPSLFQKLMSDQISPASNPNQPTQPNQQNQAPPTPTPDQVQAAKDAALNNHPAVKHASVLHKVAETLAGGPRTITTFDPQTGERIEKKQPLTTKQIIVGALANILGTAGNAASAFGAGLQNRTPPPAQPLPTQAAAEQAAQQSEEDFNRQQNMRVRQAKVMTANLEAMRLSYAMRHEEDASLDEAISNHAGDLENWNKAGAVEASQVPSSQLLSKGFDKSKYVAIPDGRTPVYDNNTGKRTVSSDGVPVSELTYSVVDGTTQAPLTQDKYQQLVNYGLMRPQKPLSDQGDTFKLPEGATISSAQLALMNHKIGLIQQTQRELDEVHKAVGGDTVNLAEKIKQNPKILSALEAFHNDGTSDDPAKQLVNLRAANNPKAQAAVGTMISLFGQDNLDKWLARTQNAPDKMDANSAQQIISDPRTDKNSPAYKTATAFLADTQNRTLDTKKKEGAINEQARIDAEDRKEQAKDKSTMGYVEDQNGNLHYVSKYDAQNSPTYSAQSFSEMKPSDIAKDRAVIKPLGDVQMNLNHYRTATNNYAAAVQGGKIGIHQAQADKDNLTTIFSAPDVGSAASAHAGAGGIGISIPTVAADLNASLAKKVTNAYNSLSPEGKAMADNYVRARAAIPAWVKALTNSGTGSKEQLEIELQNLLPPYYNPSDIHNRLDGFQDNLDNQKHTLPQNLLGQQIPAPATRGGQQPPQQTQNPAPPPGATQEAVDGNGNVVGHVVNGVYVPLQKGQ